MPKGAITRERTYEVARSASASPAPAAPAPTGGFAFGRHPALSSGKGLSPRGAEERESNPFDDRVFYETRKPLRPRLLEEGESSSEEESTRSKVIDNVDLSSPASSAGGGVGRDGGVSRSSSTVTATTAGQQQGHQPRPRDFVYDGPGVGGQGRRRGFS